MKKFIICLIFAGGFAYLSLRGVDFSAVLSGLKTARYGFLLPSFLLFLLAHVIRSLRWGVILSPMVKLDQKTLFPIICIGYLATTLIPLRIGELVRPYLISVKKEVPYSSSLATILVERVLDVIILIIILLSVLIILPIPQAIFNSAMVLLGIALLLVVIMIFFALRTNDALRLFKPIFKLLPSRIYTRIDSLLRTFIQGFKVISNGKALGYTCFLTLLIWGVSGLAIYTLFFFSNFQLPLVGAFEVLSLTDLGISLPTAPGFLGNFQFASTFALSLLGIPKEAALAYSIAFYVLGVIVINILLGLIFLPFERTSLQQIKSFRNF